MPCDTIRNNNQQSIQERAREIRAAQERLERLLLKRLVKPIVSREGAIVFANWSTEDRNGITDACIYRRIMATGSALARAEITRAEALAGRPINRAVVNAGIHSHDGGQSWHPKD